MDRAVQEAYQEEELLWECGTRQLNNRGQEKKVEPVLVSEYVPKEERINELPIKLSISKLNTQPESSKN